MGEKNNCQNPFSAILRLKKEVEKKEKNPTTIKLGGRGAQWGILMGDRGVTRCGSSTLAYTSKNDNDGFFRKVNYEKEEKLRILTPFWPKKKWQKWPFF